MSVILFFGILSMVVGIIIFFICTNREQNGIKPILALILCVTGILNTLYYSGGIIHPSAMDVYQGKTELRITYEGKTPVDSTVIYKEERSKQ